MITNELLVEKYQTQKILDKIAHHNLAKYVEDTHSRVQQLSAKLGLNLRYGTPNEARVGYISEASYTEI